MEIKERLRKFDSHSSVSKEFRVFTIQGAALSVVTCLGAFHSIPLSLSLYFVFSIFLGFWQSIPYSESIPPSF